MPQALSSINSESILLLKKITPETYENMIQGASVLEQDTYGPKVFILADGTMLKLFNPKPLLSSATLFPYAKRFARNARLLQSRNIPTITMIDVLQIPHRKLTGVHYHPLPGETFRSIGKQVMSKQLIQSVAAFVAGLHSQGIYFRSFHLGNVIVMGDGRFGLIDIADLWMRNRPLTEKERVRNIARVYRFADEIAMLRSQGDTLFVDRYIECAKLSNSERLKETLQTQQDEFLKKRRTV